MNDVVDSFRLLSNTPVPNLLVVAGLILFVTALIGRFGAYVDLTPRKQITVFTGGLLLVAVGIIIYLSSPEGPPVESSDDSPTSTQGTKSLATTDSTSTTASRDLATVAFAAPTSEVVSDSRASLVTPHVTDIAVCSNAGFSIDTNRCTVREERFAYGVTIVFVSWRFHGVATTHSRRYYYNNTPLPELTKLGKPWGRDGEVDYTYVQFNEGLPVGAYRIDFHIDDSIEPVGSIAFHVESQ